MTRMPLPGRGIRAGVRCLFRLPVRTAAMARDAHRPDGSVTRTVNSRRCAFDRDLRGGALDVAQVVGRELDVGGSTLSTWSSTTASSGTDGRRAAVGVHRERARVLCRRSSARALQRPALSIRLARAGGGVDHAFRGPRTRHRGMWSARAGARRVLDALPGVPPLLPAAEALWRRPILVGRPSRR